MFYLPSHIVVHCINQVSWLLCSINVVQCPVLVLQCGESTKECVLFRSEAWLGVLGME